MPDGGPTPYYKTLRNKRTGEIRQLVSYDEGATWDTAGSAPPAEPVAAPPPAAVDATPPSKVITMPTQHIRGSVSGDQYGPAAGRTMDRGIGGRPGPTAGQAARTGATDPWRMGGESYGFGAFLADKLGRGPRSDAGGSLERNYTRAPAAPAGQRAYVAPGQAPAMRQNLPPAYTRARNERQGDINTAEEHHPYATGAGRFGTELAATAPAMAARPIAAAGSRLPGVAGKAMSQAARSPALAPTVGNMVKVGAAGAAPYGGLAGAGGSEATDAAGVARDAAVEAAISAVFGGALGGLTQALPGASRASRAAKGEKLRAKSAARGDEATRARAEAMGLLDPGRRRALERGMLRGQGVERQLETARAGERMFPSAEGQTAGEYAARAGQAVEELGPKVGRSIAAATEEVPQAIPKAEFLTRLRRIRGEYAGSAVPEADAIVRRADRAIAKIEKRHAGDDFLSPADLEAIKSEYSKRVDYNKPGQPELYEKIANQARGASRDAIFGREGTDWAGGGATDETQAAVRQAMADYGAADEIAKASAKRAAKEEGRPQYGQDGEGLVSKALEFAAHPVRSTGRLAVGALGKRFTRTADQQANKLRRMEDMLRQRAMRVERGGFQPASVEATAPSTAAAGTVGRWATDRVHGGQMSTLPPDEQAQRASDLMDSDPGYRARQRAKADREDKKEGAR